MKVGVLFPSRFEDPGEFLADARAMEAAGVDSVWLEQTSDGLDPLLELAAIAAVTSQLRLGLLRQTPSHVGPPTSPIWEESGRGFDTLEKLSRHRLVPRSERWRRVDVPADRDVWAKTLEDAGGTSDGVLVPMDPRLLDILRHPQDAIDRTDLLLAQG